MIAYAGIENTLKLFSYLDLQLRYGIIKLKMEYMKFHLKRQLDIDRKEIFKSLDEDK